MKPTWKNMIKLIYTSSRDRMLGQRVEVLTDFLGSTLPISRIKNETVLEIVNLLKAKGLKGSTINRYLSVISKVASTYKKQFNPSYMLYIPWQQEGSGRFEYLTEQEEANVLQYLNDRGRHDISLCVRVLVLTGMRVGELTSLTPDQVDGDWIRLWTTKTNRPRSVPIPESLAEPLRALSASGIPKDHTIRRALSEACRACGIEKNITPHSCRHTTATRLVKKGENLMVTGKYLGHNSLKTTKRYVHIEDSDLREALQKMTV